MALARTLMIQGTASSVGKSLLVAALCRIYARRGLSVAPFKAQNMALNAHVTPDGREMGRAQALQARACGLDPAVDMNPILLKPEADARAQVVVLGQSRGPRAARGYHDDKLELRTVVLDALTRLRQAHDLVLIEGAGSPAEINLRDRDLVNMFVAHAADAPVLLVGDIDRGGVFAHLVGTLALLDDADRARVRGFVINKFRGDVRLLEPGLRELEQRTERPVVGVVPHVARLRLGDEDSLSLDERGPTRRARAHELEIAVVRVPRISNTDDFDALSWEHDVVVRFIEHPREMDGADLVILPGSKSTVADLRWLREHGFAEALAARAGRDEPILGVCGGAQQLGRHIADPDGVEASPGTTVAGLGLLPLDTVFGTHKRTRRLSVRGTSSSSLFGRFEDAQGYWIHAGRIRLGDTLPALQVRPSDEDAWRPEGVAGPGAVWGTMIHGLFEHEAPRRNLLQFLAGRRRLHREAGPSIPTLETELDRWADAVAATLDMQRLDALWTGSARG